MLQKRKLERKKGIGARYHPRLFAVKQSTLTYLKSHISIKGDDELCAAVTDDHVLNVCFIFHAKFQNLLLQHIL